MSIDILHLHGEGGEEGGFKVPKTPLNCRFPCFDLIPLDGRPTQTPPRWFWLGFRGTKALKRRRRSVVKLKAAENLLLLMVAQRLVQMVC